MAAATVTSRALNRWDALKCIALFKMFIDHAGHFYFTDDLYLRAIGRSAAFIFLFLTGFASHYRFDRFLVLLAVLLTVNDWLVIDHINTLNILWTIIIIRLLLHWLETHKEQKLILHEWVIGCIFIFPSMYLMQYGSIGLLIALSGYVYKHQTEYDTKTPARFLDATLLIYGTFMAFSFEFPPEISAVMILILIATRQLILWLIRNPTQPVALPGLNNIARITARYSATIYVIHLIILGWFSGMAL